MTAFPKLTYQVYFRDTVNSAAAELGADVRRTIRAIYRHSNTTAPDAFLTSSTSFLTPYDGIEVRRDRNRSPAGPGTQLFPQLPRSPLMTQAEEDYMVDQFTKSGFKKSLQFYQHGVITFPNTLQDEITDI